MKIDGRAISVPSYCCGSRAFKEWIPVVHWISDGIIIGFTATKYYSYKCLGYEEDEAGMQTILFVARFSKDSTGI